MSAFHLRSARLGTTALACVTVAACGSFDGMTGRLANSITPYRIEVVQGNFVSKEQVEVLKPGMSRQQVRDVLGTPLMASIFHADRWDYVFTLNRPGVEKQERKLAVFFKNNLLERFEGDEMPSEADFVAKLDSRRKNAKVPVLEASEESLKAFAPAVAPVVTQDSGVVPPAVNYPPLEPPAR